MDIYSSFKYIFTIAGTTVLETNKSNSYENKWLAFIGIALLSFGSYLDYTVVNIALPTIQQELNANLVSLQWVMNIYFLALCVLATVMGRLGDLYGRRRCLYIGAGIFTIASLIAGFSFNIYLLILGRLFQGVGAAIIFPLGLSLLPQLFPENEREKVVAWFGCLGGMGLALGPLLGGLIVTYLGWRWIFFINIPICLAGYLFCFKSVTESDIQKNVSLDIKGMLLLALTMCGIVLCFIYSQNSGWTNPATLICLLVGLIASVFLFKVEQKQKNPLVDFKDYSNKLFSAGAILCFLAGVLSAVTLFFDPLYLQIIKGQSPQLSGTTLFAVPIAVFVIAFFVGWLVSRLGILNTILLGLALASLSTFLQIFFAASTSLLFILFSFVCLGSMWAMGNTVSIIAVQAAVDAERKGVATGSLVTLFNIGGSIGITIAVVIYNFLTSHALRAQQESLSPTELGNLKELISNPAHSLQITINNLIEQLFNKLFIHGFVGVMIFLFALSITGFLIVLRFKKTEDSKSASININDKNTVNI